jgi:hypothetical protein
MALDRKVEKAEEDGYCYLAPVKNTLPNVQMIGVGRLTYRPHTKRTSGWFADLSQTAPRWTQSYKELHHGKARRSSSATGSF